MLDQKQFAFQELKELQQEHKELNNVIDALDSAEKFSEFTLQKFKKRKLFIKDKIRILESYLEPDIIA